MNLPEKFELHEDYFLGVGLGDDVDSAFDDLNYYLDSTGISTVELDPSEVRLVKCGIIPLGEATLKAREIKERGIIAIPFFFDKFFTKTKSRILYTSLLPVINEVGYIFPSKVLLGESSLSDNGYLLSIEAANTRHNFKMEFTKNKSQKIKQYKVENNITNEFFIFASLKEAKDFVKNLIKNSLKNKELKDFFINEVFVYSDGLPAYHFKKTLKKQKIKLKITTGFLKENKRTKVEGYVFLKTFNYNQIV